MAQSLNKLNARGVSALSKPGRYSDGGNLYLVVEASGAKRWVFLYRVKDRQREMGLGGLNAVTLARARELATAARAQLQAGVDPIAAKAVVIASKPTFGEVADDFVTDMTPQFRNTKHIAQWTMTLTTYAAALRPKPVDEVTTTDVLNVLKPLWSVKPETASRLRGRIERVLDAAKAKGHRSGENPALWRGHLRRAPRKQAAR